VITITARSPQSVQAKSAAYFIRDDKATGFSPKVNPSGSVQLFAEVFATMDERSGSQ